MMWKSLPVESNCSFSATTYDGHPCVCVGLYYGIQYDNPVLTWLGSSVLVEHVWQLYHKTPSIFNTGAANTLASMTGTSIVMTSV